MFFTLAHWPIENKTRNNHPQLLRKYSSIYGSTIWLHVLRRVVPSTVAEGVKDFAEGRYKDLDDVFAKVLGDL